MPAKVNTVKCTGCGQCIEDCPVEAITLEEGKAEVQPDVCIDCGVCVAVCPVEAIALI